MFIAYKVPSEHASNTHLSSISTSIYNMGFKFVNAIKGIIRTNSNKELTNTSQKLDLYHFVTILQVTTLSPSPLIFTSYFTLFHLQID